MSYQGHMNDGSSVQKHSAGGLYPYIIYSQDVDGVLNHGVLTPDGDWILVGYHDTAVQLALDMKEIEADIKRLTH